MSALPPMQQVPRALPANLDAEQELLGAILINNGAFHRVAGFLRAEHFFHEGHRRIYEACATLIERGERADPVKLKAHFERDDVLAKIGGTPYLAQLARAATTVINAEDYARVVHDLALRREHIAVLERQIERAYDPRVEDDSTALIDRSVAELQAIPDAGRSDEHRPEQVGSIAGRAVEQIAAVASGGKPPGIRCGIRTLDNKLGGFHPQDLLILAGRPSMGKTALAIDIALGTAMAGEPTAIFSLEQGKEAVIQRLLARLTGIPYEHMRTGHGIDQAAVDRLFKARRELDGLPLYIDDTGARTPASIQSELLRLSVRKKIAFGVVDYLQLCRSGDRYAGNKAAEVGEITGQLKGVAKRLNIPLLALSQLSRAVESRDDKRPQLSDLRESGAIEQDADVVMFAYRAEYYEARKEPKENTPEWHAWDERMEHIRGLADVLIQKNRFGRIGPVSLKCDLGINKFSDIERADEMPSWVTE